MSGIFQSTKLAHVRQGEENYFQVSNCSFFFTENLQFVTITREKMQIWGNECKKRAMVKKNYIVEGTRKLSNLFNLARQRWVNA